MPPRLHPVRSTYSVLAAHCRGENSSEAWADWALELMGAGYDSEHIVLLAGTTPPFNGFEMDRLTARALAEAGIDASDTEQVLREYAWYLAHRSLGGAMTYKEAVRRLSRGCSELDYPADLLAFYELNDIYDDPVLYGYREDELAARAESELCAWLQAFEAGTSA
ncbi:MAG: hypothetical protein EOO11_19175 [Chitinophagaceae bacterium]|nr:MAG: hypothetical protein EOO11_19175 [Chitinophagaceae bacterium]